MVIVAVVVSLVGPALGGLLIFGARKIKRRGKHAIDHTLQSHAFLLQNSSGKPANIRTVLNGKTTDTD